MLLSPFKNNFLKVICLFVIAGILISCNKEASIVPSEAVIPAAMSSNARSNGMTIQEVPFTASAQIAYCWGENIRISGMIENHVMLTETENNNHYTRNWTVKGLTGVGVITAGILTGSQYIVKGGAEMFSIKDAALNPNGSLNLTASLSESDVVIHQGEIMLENVSTGEKVLARHVIQKVPGQPTVQNKWLCGGN